MADVIKHYDYLLADIYTWMFGDFDSAKQNIKNFFKKNKISAEDNEQAFDLGAGSGFASVALSELGFLVTALDTNQKLLDELQINSNDLSINTFCDDMLNFDKYLDSGDISLVTCLTDTILLLDSKEKVKEIFEKIFKSLKDKGKFILSFRDMIMPLTNLDRFIPVKHDEDKILTCFLEYEGNFVNVHDILHVKNGDTWELKKSSYPKLRISADWMVKNLTETGFSDISIEKTPSGLIYIIAEK